MGKIEEHSSPQQKGQGPERVAGKAEDSNPQRIWPTSLLKNFI